MYDLYGHPILSSTYHDIMHGGSWVQQGVEKGWFICLETSTNVGPTESSTMCIYEISFIQGGEINREGEEPLLFKT